MILAVSLCTKFEVLYFNTLLLPQAICHLVGENILMRVFVCSQARHWWLQNTAASETSSISYAGRENLSSARSARKTAITAILCHRETELGQVLFYHVHKDCVFCTEEKIDYYYLLSITCVGGGYLDSSVPVFGCAQLTPDCSSSLHSDSLSGYMTMRPSVAGKQPFSSSAEKRRSLRKGKPDIHHILPVRKYTIMQLT